MTVPKGRPRRSAICDCVSPFVLSEAYHLGVAWSEGLNSLPDDHAVEYLIDAVGYRRESPSRALLDRHASYPSDGHDWDGYTELSRTRFNYGEKS